MKAHIIFVAGGHGKRIQTDIPKQFVPIADKPVLMWAMEAFEKYDPGLRKIIAIPENHMSLWKDLCKQFQFGIKHELAKGGATRFESVKTSLDLIDNEGLTGVHDGVRPFPSPDIIRDVYEAARKYKAAIPVTDPIDSVRRIKGNKSEIIDRKRIKKIQTPQVFKTEILKQAYEQTYQESFTDDASVVENLNYNIHLITGNDENFKITRKFDLRIATLLAKNYFQK